MQIKSILATALLGAGAVSASPVAQGQYNPPAYQPAPAAPKGLANAMKSRGREFIGVAVTRNRDPQDPKERAIYENRNDFNSLTPENAMKWESTEPTRNNFTFADADVHVDFARETGSEIHCHTLVWHSQLPTWVSEGGFDNKTLIKIMKNHITKVAGRYKNDCTRWDVVNEALNEDGTYRESVFYNTIGEAYIPIAFAHAAKVAPKAELFYNDYNLEYNGDKTAGARRIVQLVQSYGVKIQGVGFQCHITSEVTESSGADAPSLQTLTSALKSLARLDVDVAYTEVDVRMNTPATPAKLAEQAQVFNDVATSCLNTKRCIGMTIWGSTDRYSWIPGVFPGEGAALLWGKNYRKKPGYKAFYEGILGQ